jgi:NADP-dependent 3-hydroxy acid dehydrogenase YdfG
MLLKNKIAVVYGAGGSIGSAVAIAFAREGAAVFLAGRTLDGLERVATGRSPTQGGSPTPLRSTHVTSRQSTSTSMQWSSRQDALTSLSTPSKSPTRSKALR